MQSKMARNYISLTKTTSTETDATVVTCRVFHLKLKSLLGDIIGKKCRRGIFGKVIGHIHVIEYQKRGLPHAHILLILHPG